jgi:hypothetical protein
MVGHKEVPGLVSQPGSTVLPVMKPGKTRQIHVWKSRG